MNKTMFFMLFAASVATTASAQTPDPSKAYIDAGFAAMDFNKDGKVTRTEFERFMRARIKRQAAAFDAAFAKLDANSDGKISPEEAAALSPLAQHFAEVDTNKDGLVDKQELRDATMKAQAREQGLVE